VIAVTQSGETADTIAPTRLARERGCPIIAVTNTLGSAITREADAVLFLQAGPEMAVAASKTFVTQVTTLVVLAAGIARLRGSLTDDAEADLNQSDKGLTALPGALVSVQRAKSALQRAKIRAARKDLTGAETILTDALEIGALEEQLLVARSRIRARRGDKAAAESDRVQVLRSEPSEPSEWNERGLARIETDPAGALADFEHALVLDPTLHVALQNKAHVLTEHLNRPADGLKTLNQLIELYPGYVQARIGRGVVLARQGRRAEAIADVADSLARDRSAPTLYQAANVFALTSRQNPADAERVVPLLAAALWNGFGLDVIDSDTDMDPVRNQPAFRQLIGVVRELRKELRRDGEK
jgi:tetratricopeptide (TPR) repeat protein